MYVHIFHELREMWSSEMGTCNVFEVSDIVIDSLVILV